MNMDAMDTQATKEYLFEYHFDGAEWGISIYAENPDEAREKIKAVGLARYKGEVAATIRPNPFAWALALLGAIFLLLFLFARKS